MGFQVQRSDGTTVEIVSINSDNPDYYQWGTNCANLEQDEDLVKRMWENQVLAYAEITPEESDLFWEGYYNNR